MQFPTVSGRHSITSFFSLLQSKTQRTSSAKPENHQFSRQPSHPTNCLDAQRLESSARLKATNLGSHVQCAFTASLIGTDGSLRQSVPRKCKRGIGKVIAAADTESLLDRWSIPGMGSSNKVEEEHAENGIDERESKRAKVDAAIMPQEQIVKSSGFANRALRSVLKVFVVQTLPNYAQPWQMRPQRASAGSAFILDTERKEILTNAHVVANCTTVYVRRPGNPKKWQAEVLCMGLVCDLALVTVRDEAFWKPEFMALTFSDIPELQDSILVAGYPTGGDSLSITKGIVSRITMARYAYASNKLLGIQIDAAINPGNSGGPAFSSLEKGLIGGVAFSKLTHADNIGYIIPSGIVQHFLEEYRRHGTFRGVCSVAFRWQDMENEHLRKHYKMENGLSGSLVFKVDPLSHAHNVLQTDDVILEVDGVDVADDATIEFRKEERVEFSHIIRSKHIGDHVHLKILRKGEIMSVSYPLMAGKALVPILHGVDCLPEYFIIGGVVFIPLSLPLLEHAYGSNWRRSTPAPILNLLTEYAESTDEQVVILFQILASPVTNGYRFQSVRLERFNDQEVRNLQQLAQSVDECTENFMKFSLEGGKCVILDAMEAKAESPRILEMHAISFDRSKTLRCA